MNPVCEMRICIFLNSTLSRVKFGENHSKKIKKYNIILFMLHFERRTLCVRGISLVSSLGKLKNVNIKYKSITYLYRVLNN